MLIYEGSVPSQYTVFTKILHLGRIFVCTSERTPMKYLNVYLIFSFAFFVTAAELFSPASYQRTGDYSGISSPVSATAAASALFAAQSSDSLALVALYNSTNGLFWSNRWNLLSPVNTWYGVQLDAEGYVVELHLNNNRLGGTLPVEIGGFSRLEYLQIDNNAIGGSIPAEIGQLSNLSILFVDDNNFSGPIPDELSNCTLLMTIFLDNNQFSGPIPQSFTNLVNLQTLDIFNNEFDSLPDLSGLNLQFNKFRVYNNRFTFDDIIPNLGNAMNNRYPPQDSIFAKGSATAQTGTYFEINLGIDKNLSNNSYQWFKNGLPFGVPTNSNTLVFSAIDWSDAGTYRCEVANPEAPLLTLYSRPFTINVVCGTSTLEVRDQLCTGESLVFNSVTYDQANPGDVITLPSADQYGCDSIIDIQIGFYPTANSSFSSTLCHNESMLINGVTYDRNRPSGTETILGGSPNGCDSTINIQLNFYPEITSSLNTTLCEGESMLINGTLYNQVRPSGSETLIGASAQGCDSTIQINLQFNSPVVNTLQQSLCIGESLMVNGMVYDQSQASGTEVITGGAANGCDSTIIVDLQFNSSTLNVLNTQLCPGESLMVNGTLYHAGNPSGNETLIAAAANGCDSLVQVNLTFSSPVIETINSELCTGSSLLINGTVYDESSPSGTEVLAGAAVNGCDSTIQVNLTFNGSVTNSINSSLCSGSSLMVNGNVYDESNPSGTEVLVNGSANGCDSIIQINLTFNSTILTNLSPTLCSDESLLVNSTIYNQANPSGSEMLMTTAGCDSLIQINLNFHPPAVSNLRPSLCDGETLLVNGNTYDQNNPTGAEVLTGASSNGCDSTIQVQLEFIIPTASSFSRTLCDGGSMVIDNEVFDQSNPSGMVRLEGAGQNGCDSLVAINLNFLPPAVGNFQPEVCSGDQIIFNGNTYDETRLTGTEVLPGIAQRGCDSIVMVELQILPVAAGRLEQTLCEGSEMTINGVRYDMNNPSGTEVFPGIGAGGCDSVLQVELDFMSFVTTNLNLSLCDGDQIEVNGNVYNQGSPSGTETFVNGSVNGCDSIVNIALSFNMPVSSSLSPELCIGDVLVVNGSIYDESRTTGTEIMAGAAANGCDSIIQVDIHFNTSSLLNLNEMLCAGESLTVNGNIYNQSQPSGIEILGGASSSGCDSVIRIELSFMQPVVEEFRPDLCSGETLTINGTVYSESQSSGVEILSNAAANGCDSILQIDLNFHPTVEEQVQVQLCEGENYSVNGEIYDANNPSGSTTLVAASQNGCDSILQIELSFYPTAEGQVQLQLCEGETYSLNGEIYDVNNPSGSTTLIAASQNGCDSIVQVDLQFMTSSFFSFADTICIGEVYNFNGNTYTNSGTYEALLTNTMGCDSSISLQLLVQEVDIIGEAYAGEDAMVCANALFLDGNLPTGTSGQWSTDSEAILLNANQATTQVEGLNTGTYTFIWSLSTAQCSNYDRDTLILTKPETPLAADDFYVLQTEDNGQNLDLLDNDNLPEDWMFRLLTPPVQGQVEEEGIDQYTFQWPANFSGDLDFRYEICNALCPDLCDTAIVQIRVQEEEVVEEITEIPNGFTPNGDGVNEYFVIPMLEQNPDQFPKAELIVFNRWGDIIYQAKPYHNDWNGSDSSGKPLPHGTYYYVLRLNFADGDQYKGDVTILK